MKIVPIAGARPNFMKIAPIIHQLQAANCRIDNAIDEGADTDLHSHPQRNVGKLSFRLIHTGLHYDKNMSDTFFEELQIPQPDANLGCKN